MNLWDIVKKVGAAVVENAVPGGAAIVQTVNALLPSDKRLPISATGDDVRSMLSTLTPEQQSAIMNKKFDIDITQIKEAGSTLRDMLESEAKSQHTTRPYIAKQAFNLVAVISLIIIFGWMYAVVRGNKGMVDVIVGGWPFVAAIIAPFVALLRAYFGILKSESQHRINSITGQKSGLADMVAAIRK